MITFAIDSLTVTGIVSAVIAIGLLVRFTCCRDDR